MKNQRAKLGIFHRLGMFFFPSFVFNIGTSADGNPKEVTTFVSAYFLESAKIRTKPKG